MTDTLLHVGTAACFAGCGALALAAQWCGRRAAALDAAEPARLHVSEIEPSPFPSGTGGLEAVEPYAAFDAGEADALEFQYCPQELRVTAHAVDALGARRCWHCCPTQGEA
ncbi:hypothetical protein [Streptomyces afghaniensis]|uniref:hypothetical protein n=1 Tax=Streptomyces afghaniensis TaxID=66865 RepID=UPI002780D8DD|nr:hypothetical protein [Streptomyces afghaniensis]MDQ1018801.1 hypothetical protein [Streptomyces afghaniensis]